MTEIKKGTPVWVWDLDESDKKIGKYAFFDDMSGDDDGCQHFVLTELGFFEWFANAEPINETNDKALQLIAEAKEKIAEAEKLLNAL